MSNDVSNDVGDDVGDDLSSGDAGAGERTIHQFVVSRCATTFDPLEAVADANRQAQAEQVLAFLMDPGDDEALDYHYRIVASGVNDEDSGDVDVDLVVRGREYGLVRAAAQTLHNRYHGHPEPEAVLEEVDGEVAGEDHEWEVQS